MDRLRRAGQRRQSARRAGQRRALLRLLVAAVVAHVTIDPPEATRGRFARLAFRVPTERDDATTTRFSVQLPAEHPVRFVSVRPHPGWDYQVETTPLDRPIPGGHDEITEAVSSITWTGGEIAPGEFDEFVVSLGPLPVDTDQLQFPSVQTYDDGEVVRYGGDGADERDDHHPTPAVTLVADDAGTRAHRTAKTANTAGNNTAGDKAVDSARRLAATSLVIATIGLSAAAIALARSRRPTGR
jgi:uncharacterized protein YcnI